MGDLSSKFKIIVARNKARKANTPPTKVDANGLTAKERWSQLKSLDREYRKVRRNGVKKKGLSPPSSRERK